MNKFSKAVLITSVFAVSSLLQAEGSFGPGSSAANSGVNPAGVNHTNTNPSNVNPYGANPSNTNPTGANPYGTNPSTSNPSVSNPYGTNPNGSNSSLTNPSTNPNSSVNPANPTSNVYTKPSNLSTQGRLNTSYNEDNNLAPISLTDDEITQKIRATIRNEKNLSDEAKKITVTTLKGNVTLKGYVTSEDEKNKLATLTRKVAGVKSISNNLNLSSHR